MKKWCDFCGNNEVVIFIANQKELDLFNKISKRCHLYGTNYWCSHTYRELVLWYRKAVSDFKLCVEYSSYKGFTYASEHDYLGYDVIPFVSILEEFKEELQLKN